ncbi:MAG: oxidoreductase, partial [Rhizobiales bacterium]|nr:oxidoreductase [Hyphomicrobiales bacterium]
MSLYALPLTAPFVLLLSAGISWWLSERHCRSAAAVAEVAALLALAVALASIVTLVVLGTGESTFYGNAGIGLSTRLDAVSVTMLVLVAFVGWIVVRYSRTYLDGEPRQCAFISWLTAALAAVLLLVQAGNLSQLVVSWIATSLCLHRLLLFYPSRIAAQRAARKKLYFTRIGAASLLTAAIMMTNAFGTTDIAAINAAARNGNASSLAVSATIFITLAALLKSAQFPTHGWLTEVMEAPTPVSALLHAGVINGGGFLLVRFADVMLLSPGTLAVL